MISIVKQPDRILTFCLASILQIESRIMFNQEEIQEQLEAFKVFFKELFDTDIQNSDGGYKSAYDIFLEASKKFHSKTENITM